MPVTDLSFRIGGEAGQGVESSGAGFAKALTRAGLHVIGVPDYYSRIRGGHNYFTIRASDQPVWAVKETIEVLLALDGETVARHIGQITPGGAIIIDEKIKFNEGVLAGHKVHLVRLPLAEIAEHEGNALMVNTGALAVAAALTGFDLEYMMSVIADNFGRKGAAVTESNRRVAQSAHALVRERYGDILSWKIAPQKTPPPRMCLTGNHAFAMGALMGGCKFEAAYPMTPATAILEYMAAHADWGVVAKHAEDEIAAVNMAVGAAHAGVRAMASTSGGGFDLMTEGISLAGMCEAPLVIFLGGRPGPATGMATRTAQADLFLAMHASHGEFPRVILAPHTPEECFLAGVRAFNTAEKYQCVVIVLSDHYLADSFFSKPLDNCTISSVQIDRGKLLSASDLDKMDGYKRYAYSDDGVSPRALPASSPKAVYLVTSDEHPEDGQITEDPGTAVAMADKRLRKLETARADIRPPYQYGPREAQLTLVSWGSSFGPVYEAMNALNARGMAANMVQFVDLWPFPAEAARESLADAKRIVVVEGNATAQFAFLLHAYGGIRVDQKLLRYDGRSFTAEYILDRLEAK